MLPPALSVRFASLDHHPLTSRPVESHWTALLPPTRLDFSYSTKSSETDGPFSSSSFPLPLLPSPVSSFSAAEEIIKVPSMAESITEGTLKQWLKQKGDYVEADEEIATIETDKVSLPSLCSERMTGRRW